MINQEHDSLTLMQQEADSTIVDVLYRHGFINQQARDYALDLLYPHQRWGYWTAQALYILGCAFIITGLCYYFAINWQTMSPSYKFITIETGLFCCVAGAWTYSLSKLSGQLFLTGACLLVGAFVMVFGQVYQTGANDYLLYLAWTLLIIPWVFISHFPLLWMIWFILINISLDLLGWHFILPSNPTLYYISFVTLSLATLVILIIGAYKLKKSFTFTIKII